MASKREDTDVVVGGTFEADFCLWRGEVVGKWGPQEGKIPSRPQVLAWSGAVQASVPPCPPGRSWVALIIWRGWWLGRARQSRGTWPLPPFSVGDPAQRGCVGLDWGGWRGNLRGCFSPETKGWEVGSVLRDCQMPPSLPLKSPGGVGWWITIRN